MITCSTGLSYRTEKMPSPSPSPFLQALCRAAPSLSREFFGCRQCLRLSTRAIPSQLPIRNLSTLSKKQLTPIRGKIRHISASSTIETAVPAGRKLRSSSRFPDSSSNAVAYWLLGSAASVFGIVVFGGLTRLTESGYVSVRECLLRTSIVDRFSQIEHYRMEASDWFRTSSLEIRLGFRVP